MEKIKNYWQQFITTITAEFLIGIHVNLLPFRTAESFV